jgi:hypothetical protein
MYPPNPVYASNSNPTYLPNPIDNNTPTSPPNYNYPYHSPYSNQPSYSGNNPLPPQTNYPPPLYPIVASTADSQPQYGYQQSQPPQTYSTTSFPPPIPYTPVQSLPNPETFQQIMDSGTTIINEKAML